MAINIPEHHDFGFGPLVEIEYLMKAFDIKRPTAIKYLAAFRIHPLYVGKRIFFSLVTFKRILFVLTRPGSKGFMFPGSYAKNSCRKSHDPNLLTEVTADILERAADPAILAEMSACTGQDDVIIRKFAQTKKEE